MAFKHGKDTKVFLNSTDLSSYLNNADATRTADIAESTTFGKSAKTYLAGGKDGTITLAGFFDPTADSPIQTNLGSTGQELVMGIDGVDATDSVTFGKGNFTTYGISSPVGDIVAFSADFQSDEGIFNGTVLENATVTATGSGTARDNASSTGNGGGAFIIVTSASGTSPTLDAKITHSADNSTYADLVTFTQATTATSEVKTVAKGTTVNRYLKVEYTVSGSTPSFAVIIGFGRNN
jgi:hypothetical protein